MVEASGETAQPTMLFDGDCAFCTTRANWLAAHTRCAVRPWQFANLDAHRLTAEHVQRSVWLLDARGVAVASAGRAIALALRTSEFAPWRFVGVVLGMPIIRNIAEVGYRVVARNRHRLPGGTPACAMPVTASPK
ncbi:MAG TPA: DUF393 domain-containing protein [Candidatus Lumbricidophila sp.]|nr:DUF393 domain-containing protein [Candidatus Lumbricidophila sp.]